MGGGSTGFMGNSTLIKKLFTPHAVIFLTALLSFTAWLLPDFGILRKGFSERFSIFSIGFFTAGLWYLLAIVTAFVGYHFTRVKLSPDTFDKYASFQKKNPYLLLSLFAIIGCFASYSVILSSVGLRTVYYYLTSGQANQLKYILYEDYSAGLLSLRYLSIQSCAMAVFRRYKLGLKSRLDFINVFLLLSIVIISSRLSLIMAIFLCLVLFISHSSKIKLKPLKVISAGAFLFIVLSILSYTRNKGFYESKGYGFWSAGISEIVTYLGTPFQGAVAVGNSPHLITKSPEDWTQYAAIEPSLSTNSAFLQLFQSFEWYAFLVMFLTVAVFSFMAGFLKKQRNNYIYLSVLSILYAFAEFWRLYWFGTGIMITLVAFPIIITVLSVFLSRSAWRTTTSQ